jgi:hypothetical protein
MKSYLIAVIAALAIGGMADTAHAANIFSTPRPVGGGSYLYITGEIVPGDEQTFASLDPPAPVYVRPSGPGGNVRTALAIADTLVARGYRTMNARADGSCASSCAVIWLSGYATHAIADNNSLLGFHSCFDSDTNLDDLACDAMIARHLVSYGFTPQQAHAIAYISPHEHITQGTLALASSLGLAWQTLPNVNGHGDLCQARLCVTAPPAVNPIVPFVGLAAPFFLHRRFHY